MKEHYYLERLPEEIQDFLVADTDDPLIHPQDEITEDKVELKQIYDTLCQIGKIAVFYNGKIAILVSRKTRFLGSIDTKVGKDTGARDVIRGYKSFVEWARTNTFYYKLETRTPLEKFAKTMAKSVPGAKLEGVCEKSYMTKEGTLMDEYIVGFKLKEVGKSCQS